MFSFDQFFHYRTLPCWLDYCGGILNPTFVLKGRTQPAESAAVFGVIKPACILLAG